MTRVQATDKKTNIKKPTGYLKHDFSNRAFGQLQVTWEDGARGIANVNQYVNGRKVLGVNPRNIDETLNALAVAVGLADLGAFADRAERQTPTNAVEI